MCKQCLPDQEGPGLLFCDLILNRPVVILTTPLIPLLSGPRMLMNRNLLYTAVTRAKKCVTIVGNDTTFEQMIANNSQLKRYSGLCDRLVEDATDL